MKIRSNFLIILNLILFGYAGICSAQETLTVTTYYPAPYGVYDALQLQPNDTVPACDDPATDMGKLHLDNGFGGAPIPGGAGLYICNDDTAGDVRWDSIPIAGSLGRWTHADRGANDDAVYPDNLSWVVGMGTDEPGKANGTYNGGVRLHVKDNNSILNAVDRAFCHGWASGGCTSAVIEGASGSALHITSEDAGEVMSHLVFSNIDTDDTDGILHNHWAVSAWGPDENNHFGIGHFTSSGDFDLEPADVIEYLTVHTDGRVNIPDIARLDLELQYTDDAAVGNPAAACAYCSGVKDVPIAGGCECDSDVVSIDDIQIRESYPVYSPPGSGWLCECYTPSGLGDVKATAYVFCADIYVRP